MSFHQPSVWFLCLLALLPVCWWWAVHRRPRAAVGVSTLGFVRAAGVPLMTRLRWIVPALRAAAVVLLVVAIARPRQADEMTRVTTEGIAIQLVVDRSGSMDAGDFELDGRAVTRLAAVQRVVQDFVAGTDDLPGRRDDLVGVVTFASYADSLCPLTLDHDHVVEAIESTTVATQAEGAGTAIGDALALGVERLRHIDERADLAGRTIVSRVIILLTDGENNSGDVEPSTAAEMAEAFGIKVYTIGAGSRSGTIDMVTYDPFSGAQISVPRAVSIDERTLKDIASITGGMYFRATDTDSLRDIYAQIDALETTKIEQHRYTHYGEAAIESTTMAGLSLPPILPIVFVLLAVELVLASTRFRRLP